MHYSNATAAALENALYNTIETIFQMRGQPPLNFYFLISYSPKRAAGRQ